MWHHAHLCPRANFCDFFKSSRGDVISSGSPRTPCSQLEASTASVAASVAWTQHATDCCQCGCTPQGAGYMIDQQLAPGLVCRYYSQMARNNCRANQLSELEHQSLREKKIVNLARKNFNMETTTHTGNTSDIQRSLNICHCHK